MNIRDLLLWGQLAGQAVACLSPNLSKRQAKKDSTTVFFTSYQVQNTNPPVIGVTASIKPLDIPDTLGQKKVVVAAKDFDSNTELNNTMYMIQCSQNEGIIFDTLSSGSFFQEAAGLLQQTGLKAMTNMRIIASHEHQDHTGGLSGVRNVQNLRNAEIIAQKNNDAVKQAQVQVGETQNEKCGDATIDLVHTQGHTTAGVMACTGGFCLAGDECEDSVPFIAQADNLNEQIRGLTKSIQTMRQLGASRVLQAHGNMQAVADGSLGLKVCESNLVYKKKMVNDFTTLCPNGSNISPKQLAKEINRNEGDITKEYLDVHNDNCDSVRQARRGR